MSLMKNFFLQIVNKSQGEILKYKQAYESQRERRKACEAKLAERAEGIMKTDDPGMSPHSVKLMINMSSLDSS